MVTIPIKTRLEADGTLSLHVPTGLPESDVEVLLVVQPISDATKPTESSRNTRSNARLRGSSRCVRASVDLLARH